MGSDSMRSNVLAASVRDQKLRNHTHHSNTPSSPSVDHQFDESQCLFCNQMSPDLSRNLVHMSKAHGLHVDETNLLVDVGTLLAYMHVIISEYHECLYCGTQRNTRLAAQQHMMAKGHCKYEISNNDTELSEFYDSSLPNMEDNLHRHQPAMRFSSESHPPSWTRLRKIRPSRHSDENETHPTASSSRPILSTPPLHPQNGSESHSNPTHPPSPSQGQVSTRAIKQEHTITKQLAQLRTEDRRSLAHLPTSQQRTLLATHHKQMEKARRTEQTQRSNLENAANTTGCLDKIRLIRKPPHTGNVASLKR